ncbi:hypothetical protein TIFTF001_014308 [Ficus carica]|uniref:Uncharacterized protein n=1 Tax=Ficus carica TaxID=3494 RepID=A0AA88D6V6_FICCA|nr:hypothetical protein TIFTF001_014308 [Ficus carica]
MLALEAFSSELFRVLIHGRPVVALAKVFKGYDLPPGMVSTYSTVNFFYEVHPSLGLLRIENLLDGLDARLVEALQGHKN